MSKTILMVLAVVGTLSLTVQAQTTPAGTSAKPGNPSGKTTQSNSGNSAPNRSSTAGAAKVQTSNNPVDATGRPVGTTGTDKTSTVKASKRKN